MDPVCETTQIKDIIKDVNFLQPELVKTIGEAWD